MARSHTNKYVCNALLDVEVVVVAIVEVEVVVLPVAAAAVNSVVLLYVSAVATTSATYDTRGNVFFSCARAWVRGRAARQDWGGLRRGTTYP